MSAVYAVPTQDFLQKTLDAQLLEGVTASATLNNTTGIQNLPGVFLVDRVDTNDVETPIKREVIAFSGTSGSTVTTLTRGLAGTTDQDHAVGAIVEFAPDVIWAQSIYDALSNVTNVSTGAIKQNIVFNGIDLNGTKAIIDADADTSITADTDDQIDFETAGADAFRMKTTDLDLVNAAGNVTVAGADPKRALYIPATGLFPATTTGCAALAQGETTTNKINYKYLAFDASTEEYAWVHLPTPDYWDLGTVTVKFHWTAGSSSGDVIWGAAGLCRSDDDALDTALGTAVTVTDTLTATGDEHTTSATAAITIGGTPAKGDKLYLRVYRDADAGGDTLAADAHLTGITVKFGIGQYDDQ